MPMTKAQMAGFKSHETRRRNLELAKKPKVKAKPLPQVEIKMPKAAPLAKASDMMLSTSVMVLTINGIGNRRKVDPNSLDILDAESRKEVNKDWLGITRKLMDAPELKTITSIGNKAKAYVLSLALPSHIKIGVYLMPKEFEDAADEKLEGFVAEMKPHIEDLVKHLPEYKKEAKKQQGPQFNEEQFPTAGELRDAFAISWRYLYVDSAQGLSKKLAEKERQKAEAAWTETANTVQQLLRAQFAEQVNHFIDRLTPEGGYKYKMFTEGSLTKFQDFFDTFKPRNIVNDTQLAALVEHAQGLMKGASGDTLRSDDQFREYVRTGFENIKTLLDPLVVDKPHRIIKVPK